MDLEKKLQFLAGNDEYAMPSKKKSDIDEISYDLSETTEVYTPVEFDEDISINSYLDLKSAKESSTKSKKEKKKKRSEIFDMFDDDDNPFASHPELNKLYKDKSFTKFIKSMSEDMIDDFESYLRNDDNFVDDDSDELRNGLIAMGRKYARDTNTGEEKSEVVKTFSASEKRLKDLYDEIARDKMNIQKDIDQLRGMTRGKNFKALSDLNSSKTSYHSTQLQAIKELNAIKKAEFDMRMKERAAKLAAGAGNGGDDISTTTIRSLFGAGRNDLIGATGGYSRVSGAYSSTDVISTMDMSDDEIEEKYFSDYDEEESDGDKFLEYEGQGVEYVLLIDDDDSPVEVVAKDREGNIVPDYPMPTNFEQLRFSINTTTKSAEDDLHRKYKIERI